MRFYVVPDDLHALHFSELFLCHAMMGVLQLAAVELEDMHSPRLSKIERTIL